MMRALTLVIATLTAGAAGADEGELSLRAAAALEGAMLRHPLADGASASAEPSLRSISLVPRVMLGARYGITNEVHLGLGFDAGGAANVASDDVILGGTTTRLITGGYFELAAPLSLAWRVDSGYDVSAAVLLELAPMVALWSATAATDPAKLSDDGLARRLPFEVADALTPGLQARVQLVLEARVFGAFAIRGGAYAGAAWAGAPSLRVGIVIEPSWIVSPGPP